MADDLRAGDGEVHRGGTAGMAEAVLAFWLDELDDERRFAKDAGLDATIRDRFGEAVAAVTRGGAVGWTDAPRPLLAAVILLDQFSRNLNRDDAAAFAADPLALALARLAIARGWDAGLTVTERQFLYMPFMHSEAPAVQDESVALFATLGDERIDGFATGHRDLIRRFGRFPHRNAALGRASTAAERDYLSQPGAGY